MSPHGKYVWLLGVLADRELSRGAARLAGLIAERLDDDGVFSAPRRGVATSLGCSTVMASIMVRDLRDRGHIIHQPGCGRGHWTRITPILSSEQARAA